MWAREVYYVIRIVLGPEIHQMQELITQIPPRAKKACHKICTNEKFALRRPRLLAKKGSKGWVACWVFRVFQIGADPTAARIFAHTALQCRFT